MARIRTIKPSHVLDKELSNISLQAHLFWILSWCFSDDEGILENDPLLLKSQLFPRRTDIRTEQVQQWIDQLVKARLMIPFTHEGESYLLHRTFHIHQKIDRPQPSKIPTNFIENIRLQFDEHSSNIRPCIVKESIVKESNRDAPAKKFVKPSINDLENFFSEIGLDDFTAQAQASLFFSHYESNGWKVGKNSMKEWKAAAHGWKNRMKNFDYGKNNSGNSNSGSKTVGRSIEFDRA